MDFLNNFYLFFNSFFSNYNYNALWWYVFDNFLPSKFSVGFSNVMYSFLLVFEKSTSVILSLLNSIFSIFSFTEIFLFFGLTSTMVNAICVALKFLLCIAVLIFARGGIPRFRFDYLTKLGWIRFLSLVLLSFLIEILLLSMV